MMADLPGPSATKLLLAWAIRVAMAAAQVSNPLSVEVVEVLAVLGKMEQVEGLVEYLFLPALGALAQSMRVEGLVDFVSYLVALSLMASVLCLIPAMAAGVALAQLQSKPAAEMAVAVL
jgi:hypothetical protein